MPKKKSKKTTKTTKTTKTSTAKTIKRSRQQPILAAKKGTPEEYTAKQIVVLEGLAPVRKRPGMYIGNTAEEGLHHLIWEAVDNSIDEAMAGRCDKIIVRLLPDNMAEIIDNGAGIPVEKHPQTKKSALETVMTTLHAGAKFGEGGYKVSGGLHGVGISVTNALSEWMKADVKRDGKLWRQEYKRGKPLKKVKAVGQAQGTGTTVVFKPDPEIFTVLEFNWQTVVEHIRQQAYLTKGVTIRVFDDRVVANKKEYSFHFEGGISSYVRQINQSKEVKQETIFYIDKEEDNVRVEIAVQYTGEYTETIFAFANNILNPEGGMHLVGFRTALTRVLNNYARKNGFLKEKDPNLSGEDVREGLTAVISVKVKNPQFEGQTKAKLGNAEVRPVVDSVLSSALEAFLEEHPQDAKEILGKTLLAQEARVAARAARDSVIRKGALEGMTLPGKLADCSNRDASMTELYIVEGDSAGGCFSGETKVALLDGRNLSFAELVKEHKDGRQNYCYTILEDGSIGVALIKHPRITKKNTEVIKVILDNDEEIICTTDHRFMLKDGSYIKAKNLKDDLSLMPLKRKFSRIEKRITIKGYEMVYDSVKNEWIFTHLLSDKYNLENKKYSQSVGRYKHHQDFNKLNNNPDNIIRMTREDHLKLHAKMVEKTIHRPDVQKKSKEAKQKPEFRDKMSKIMSAPRMREMLSSRAKKQWQSHDYKLYMAERFMEFYQSNQNYQKESQQRLYQAQKEYWSKNENRERQAKQTKEYYQGHPEFRKELSKIAKKQWGNPELLERRRERTKEQWTNNFRVIRKKAYDQTYFDRTIAFMKKVLEDYGHLDGYDYLRAMKRNNNLLSKETFAARFFNWNKEAMLEAVENYNHKIKKIIRLNKRIDVYDLEVEKTHNFALASGIFVHNSAKQGRNRNFQAILPLRGKILNVERARLDKMLANNEVKSLVIALGTNIGDQFDISKLRYHKVIIMTDADVDGSHIRTLLLTLFYRYFPQVIEGGYLYIAQPPLYRLQRGSNVRFVYTEEEKEKAIVELTKEQKSKITKESNKKIESLVETQSEGAGETVGERGVGEKISGVNIQRYKGLGEMNPEQLWDTTMDPVSRLMMRVTIDDGEKADEIFDILMGSDVAPRKRFIQTQAKNVKNLDI